MTRSGPHCQVRVSYSRDVIDDVSSSGNKEFETGDNPGPGCYECSLQRGESLFCGIIVNVSKVGFRGSPEWCERQGVSGGGVVALLDRRDQPTIRLILPRFCTASLTDHKQKCSGNTGFIFVP